LQTAVYFVSVVFRITTAMNTSVDQPRVNAGAGFWA
jgi:hypothetical protein